MTAGDPPMPGAMGPGRPNQDPPPPGPAQRLVSQAGFTVYEGGHSMFTEPVLVYLGVRHSGAAAFKVHDHVDRPLGYSKQKPTTWINRRSPVEIHDPFGAPLLQVRWRPTILQFSFSVEGVASATFSLSTVGGRELAISRDREPFGVVTGFGMNGRRRNHMEVFDHDRRSVANIRVFDERYSLLRSNANYVMSIEPSLGGELRRLLIAVPLVAEMIRDQLDKRNTVVPG